MTDSDFDGALIAGAFRVAAEEGWRKVSVVSSARAAGLPLPEARARFPARATILLRFGRMADQAALMGAEAEGPVRDRLFDLLMRRFDALQQHRAGVLALMHALPSDPPAAAMLACATRRSMRWMLQAAGVSASGLRGEMQIRGLMAVWLWALRAWTRDETSDMSATMVALDNALARADQAAGWVFGRRAPPPPASTEGGSEPGETPSPDDSEMGDPAEI